MSDAPSHRDFSVETPTGRYHGILCASGRATILGMQGNAVCIGPFKPLAEALAEIGATEDRIEFAPESA